MKKIVLCLLAVMAAFSLHAQNPEDVKYERHWKKNMEKVRIMSYNILNGFGWGEDLEREDRFVEWIKLQDPEILGLQELCSFDLPKLKKLAARYGHPYAEIVIADGYPVGVTSKKPIVLKHKIEKDCGHGLVHVQTYGFDILVTHLNPANTLKRQKEAEMISRYIQENQLDNCMLMGDMNSHSPFDADYMESHAYNLLNKYGGKSSTNLLDGQFDYAVISHFLSVPLIDICRKYVEPDKRTTFPTPVLMGQSRHAEYCKKTNERLDYLLLSPKVASLAVDAFIFNEGPTEYLSDHYPIAVDLLLDHNKK